MRSKKTSSRPSFFEKKKLYEVNSSGQDLSLDILW